MKASVFIDEEQLVAKAVEVLIKELGPVETSRFLSLPKKLLKNTPPHKLRHRFNMFLNRLARGFSTAFEKV